MRSTRIQVPLGWALQIANRDRFRCHICEQGYSPVDPWEIDHVLPLALGGTNHVANLALAHRSCNQAKGALPVGGSEAAS